jgi:hypothetical protein
MAVAVMMRVMENGNHVPIRLSQESGGKKRTQPSPSFLGVDSASSLGQRCDT